MSCNNDRYDWLNTGSSMTSLKSLRRDRLLQFLNVFLLFQTLKFDKNLKIVNIFPLMAPSNAASTVSFRLLLDLKKPLSKTPLSCILAASRWSGGAIYLFLF